MMPTKQEIENDAFLPLRDVVFNRIRDEILKGKLKPGERLMEVSLAEKLGVSRTPVREAIRMLEQEGLVVMLPRRGAHVSYVTEKQLADVLEARKTLETFTVNAACSRITRSQLVRLKEANEAFKEAVKTGDPVKIADADLLFHNIIVEAAGNEKIAETLYNLKEQIYRYKYEYLKDMKDFSHLIKEHEMLIETIAAAQSDRAVRIIRMHIDNQALEIYRHIS